MKDFRSLIVPFAVVAAGLAAAPDASAVNVDRQQYHNGGSACTGALPAYEGALRKRPRAIVNEGSSAAFITCSMITEEANATLPVRAYARVSNSGTAAVDVACTLINGDDFVGSVSYPQTRSVGAGSSVIFLWTPDGGATNFDRRTINFTCSLPPGIGVSYVGKRFSEDVGS